MVKVKSPGLESFRHAPITRFFSRVPNKSNATEDTNNNNNNNNKSRLIVKDNNDSSKSQLNGSNNSNQQQQQFSRDNSSLSNDNISLKKENSTISLQDDDDYNILTQRIPSKLFDDEDDDLLLNNDPEEITFAKLSNQDESSQETQPTLRRSTRSRRVVFQQDYVPTVDVVPLRGDIPMRGDELTSTTPSSINTANLFPKRTYQFSLASLLREKKHRDKTGYDIKVLEKALKEDAIKDEMLNELDDPYENYENYNRSEVSAAILTEDIKHEQLQQIFEEDFVKDFDHFLEFFETIDPNLPRPIFQKSAQKLKDNEIEILLFKASSDDEILKDILFYDWISQQYMMGLNLPNTAVIWLIQLVSFEKDTKIAEAASHNLKQLTETDDKKRFGNITKSGEGINISFTIIYEILTSYGASSQMLDFKFSMEEKAQSLQSLPSSLESSPQLPQFPYISNLRLLLKTIVQLNKARWISFSNNEEIRRAIVVFLRMSSDNRIKSLSYEVEQVVDSLLYLIQKDEWVLQVKLICEDIILSCGNVTQFKIDILENLPASNRGRLTRRLLSACFLFSSTSSITSKKSFYDFTNLDVSKPLTLMPLINLFKDGETIFKVNSNTDYKELYKNTLLLGYILDDEEQMSSEKDTVEFIIQKLKYLHGKIIDMRAAFMDRTKAKDLIQRLYMRLYYVTFHRRGKKQSSILQYSPKTITTTATTQKQRTLDTFVDQ